MDSYTDERWQKDEEFFKQRVKEQGGEVITLYASGNEELQNEQVEAILNKEVDVLVIIAHNSKSAAYAVNAAHKKGVKVIAYERMIEDCAPDLYVSFDNVEVGEMQAKYLLNLVPKGNYVVIGGAPTDQTSFMIRKGQMNVLQPAIDRGDIKIISDKFAKDWLPYEALKQTESALASSKNNIHAILATSDKLADGAIQSLKENDLVGKIPITGMDARQIGLQSIIDGSQSMTVYKPIRNIAVVAADAAFAFARKEAPKGINSKVNNGTIDMPAILVEPVVVNKKNIDQTVIADGFIQRSQLKFH